MPAVTVVVPIRNGERFVRACLGALHAQRGVPGGFEIVVVDNGSTDGTIARCRELGIEPLLEARPGAGVARNRALEAARGEILAFTDVDCEPAEDWLGELVSGLDGAEAAMGSILPSPGSGRLARARADLHGRYLEDCRRRAAEGRLERLDTANAAMRRRAFERLGGFHPEIFPAEDRDLGARLALAGGKIRYVDRARVAHRYEEGLIRILSKARSVGHMWARLPRVRSEAFLAAYFPDVLEDFGRLVPVFKSPARRVRLAMGLAREVMRTESAREDPIRARHLWSATRRAVDWGILEELRRRRA